HPAASYQALAAMKHISRELIRGRGETARRRTNRRGPEKQVTSKFTGSWLPPFGASEYRPVRNGLAHPASPETPRADASGFRLGEDRHSARLPPRPGPSACSFPLGANKGNTAANASAGSRNRRAGRRTLPARTDAPGSSGRRFPSATPLPTPGSTETAYSAA